MTQRNKEQGHKKSDTKNTSPGIEMRYTEFSDAPYLKEWL